MSLSLINKKDVVKLLIPFPDFSSDLAVVAHMYICCESNRCKKSFVKVQTLKPYMLINRTMRHYVDEPPDISRNPFTKLSRIDCDKAFKSARLKYGLELRTKLRTDICDELMKVIDDEIARDGFDTIILNEADMMLLNPYISVDPNN